MSCAVFRVDARLQQNLRLSCRLRRDGLRLKKQMQEEEYLDHFRSGSLMVRN